MTWVRTHNSGPGILAQKDTVLRSCASKAAWAPHKSLKIIVSHSRQGRPGHQCCGSALVFADPDPDPDHNKMLGSFINNENYILHSLLPTYLAKCAGKQPVFHPLVSFSHIFSKLSRILLSVSVFVMIA
jgi:hypothetical protein